MKKSRFILGFLMMLLCSIALGGVTGDVINNIFLPYVTDFVFMPKAFLLDNSIGVGVMANLFIFAYVKVDVNKASTNPGAGGNKKNYIILFDWDDVLTPPMRDDKGIVTINDIIFKPGAYMIKIYATIDSIKVNSKSDGETDAMGILQQLDFTHPGSVPALREFKANWLNRNIGAIVSRCSTDRKDLLGSPCAPLKLSFNADDDKDKDLSAITLVSSLKGPEIADYQGSLTFADVIATIAADSTSVTLTTEGEYQLTDNTIPTEIIAATGATDGMTFTLLGSGGTNPATITQGGGDFILKDGLTWTAIAGSRITFKTYKTGATSYTYLETSRA